MSPASHIFVKSGKFPFPVGHKFDSQWENFRETRSVHRFTVVKDMVKVKQEKLYTLPNNQKTKTVFGVVCREKTAVLPNGDKKKVYVRPTKCGDLPKIIIVAGEKFSYRSKKNVYMKIRSGSIASRKDEKRYVKREKMENELKTVILNGRIFRIIRKK